MSNDVETEAATQGGYPDALVKSACEQLQWFTRWLDGETGYIGEVCFPQNTQNSRAGLNDEHLWRRLGRYWFEIADRADLWVTLQQASEREYKLPGGGAFHSVYHNRGGGQGKVLCRPGYMAPLLEAHKGPRRGLNLAGGQNVSDKTRFSNERPERYNDTYWYPTVNNDPLDVSTGRNSFEYLYGHGLRLMRIGFRWEHVQPRLGADLDQGEIRKIKQCTSNARKAGIDVILDCHNYGGYYFPGVGLGARRAQLNSARLPDRALTNLWNRLHYNFADDPAVIAYELMNEPHVDIAIRPDRGRQAWHTWERISREVCSSLVPKAKSAGKQVIVALYGGCGPATGQRHPRPWLKDMDNVVYTVHHYMGSDAHFTKSYQQQLRGLR